MNTNPSMILISIPYLAFCWLLTSHAPEKGRSTVLWIIIAFCITPPVAAIILTIAPNLKTEAHIAEIRDILKEIAQKTNADKQEPVIFSATEDR